MEEDSRRDTESDVEHSSENEEETDAELENVLENVEEADAELENLEEADDGIVNPVVGRLERVHQLLAEARQHLLEELEENYGGEGEGGEERGEEDPPPGEEEGEGAALGDVREQWEPRREEARELDRVEYDITIPSQHSYLEMEMQRVEGYNYWLEGSHVTLVMIPLDVIVIPGHTLPLRVRDSTLQYPMIRSLLDGHQATFGAVNITAEREQVLLGRSWSQCGVTVQILEINYDSPGEIILKCKGRQRFRTVSLHRRSHLSLHAKVSILADHIPPRLYDPSGKLFDEFKYSSHPPWLFKSHDVYHVMDLIKVEIRKVSPLVKLEVTPTEPDMFSYWLISSMPFKFKQRVGMLQENSLLARLKSQLSHLQKLSMFDYCCHQCGSVIIESSRLVSMSSDGSFFVNPNGYVFETVTAYSTENTVAMGTPTEKDSWFPGYAWSFLSCTRCTGFLGWKFTAAPNRRDLKPRVFYGVQRKLLTVLDRRVLEEDD